VTSELSKRRAKGLSRGEATRRSDSEGVEVVADHTWSAIEGAANGYWMLPVGTKAPKQIQHEAAAKEKPRFHGIETPGRVLTPKPSVQATRWPRLATAAKQIEAVVLWKRPTWPQAPMETLHRCVAAVLADALRVLGGQGKLPSVANALSVRCRPWPACEQSVTFEH